jgi:hypothetical protein
MSTTHTHETTAQAKAPQAYNSPWGTPGGMHAMLILVVGIVGALIVFVIFTAADAWFRNMARTNQMETTFKQMDGEYKAYLEEQHRRLEVAHYTQDDKKLIAIPIEQGMEAYLKEGLQSGSK